MPATGTASQTSVCPALLVIDDEGHLWGQGPFLVRGHRIAPAPTVLWALPAVLGEVLGRPSAWLPRECFLANFFLFSPQGAQWQQHNTNQQERLCRAEAAPCPVSS